MEPLKTERLSGSWFMDILERQQVYCELFVFHSQNEADFHFSSIYPSIFILSSTTCYQAAAGKQRMMTQSRLHNSLCATEKKIPRRKNLS